MKLCYMGTHNFIYYLFHFLFNLNSVINSVLITAGAVRIKSVDYTG